MISAAYCTVLMSQLTAPMVSGPAAKPFGLATHSKSHLHERHDKWSISMSHYNIVYFYEKLHMYGPVDDTCL